MPSQCCVMGCSSNTYKTVSKISFFGFPKNKELTKKWLEAIQRKNFKPSKHSKVCVLHFKDEDILKTTTSVDAASGVIQVVKKSKVSLRAEAVPTIQLSPWEPESNKKKIKEESPEECETPQNIKETAVLKKKSLKRKWFGRELDKSDFPNEAETHTNGNDNTTQESEEFSQEECQSVTSYSNFKEFLNVVQKIKPLPNKWHLVIEQNKVNLLNLVCSPGPVVSFSITISYLLTVQTYFYGQEIHNFNTPFVTSDIKDLTLLLEKIELTKDEPSVGLTYIATLLEPYGLPFLSEQLKLHATIKQGCRYTFDTLIASLLIFLKSPSTYSLIRQLGFILPHPKTLESFYSSDYFANDENNFISLWYAANLFDTLNDKNKTVILHLDELALVDSNIKMFVFSISSPTTILREVVFVTTTENNGSLESKKLYNLVSRIILTLEEIGYKVFCIVTGCSSLILQAMAKFSLDDKWGSSYPHPSDPQRQLYHIFDPVLLLKTFLAQFIAVSGIDYPTFDSHQKRYATVQSFHVLQAFHDKNLLDLGIHYNIVASLESFKVRPSMAGFSKIFNHEISNKCYSLSTRNDKFKDTGEFINIFARLWEIIGVKTPPETNTCTPNAFGYPLMARTDFVSDRRIIFLRAIGYWMNIYKEWKFPDENMKQVMQLLGHTTQSLLELSNVCLETLKLDYVLLGSFHSSLDSQFGKYHVYLP